MYTGFILIKHIIRIFYLNYFVRQRKWSTKQNFI